MGVLKVLDRRIVTKASDDGTFQEGDHILLYDDGTIGCVEAEGWVEKDDAEEAVKGMKSVQDTEWKERRKKALQAALDKLNSE